MSEIFISYDSEDRPRAKIIAEALEHQGYSVWWDVIIPPGKTFDEVIKEELDSTKCIIVLWSRKSVLSGWVKEESSEGVKRKILIPVLIDDVEIPLGFKRIQAAQLIDWSGTLPNPEFDLLLKSVTEIVGQKQSLEVSERKIIPLKEDEIKKPDGREKIRIEFSKIVFGILQVCKYVLYEEKVSKWLKLYTIVWLPWTALCTLFCLAVFFTDNEYSFFYNLIMTTIVFLLFVIIPFLPIYILAKPK
ncbi:MAG: toll/interleukin-1 receptor domain-containing protein [Candidatus Odinarchaeia archaeon]